MLSEKNSTTLTRQELYEKVWTKPARIPAKEFGISDVALGKVCRKHKIPKPPPGYWTARQFGKAVTPIPLSNIDDQELDTVTIVDRNQREVIPEKEERQQLAEAERLRIDEQEKLRQLDRVIEAWQKSQLIRSFCDLATLRISDDGNSIKPESELGK